MIVLDASALVELSVRSPLAGWVEERLRDQHVCAPAHQPSEVVSAFARMSRAGILPGRAAFDAFDDATDLPQELVPATAQHLRRALAMQEQVRVVDGLYVALAEDRGCPLLTTDLRLARSVTTCEVWAPTD